MIENEHLLRLGLSPLSAKVYLACLSLGNTSVMQIAEKAGLKRPTVYLHVNELLTEGLLEKIPLGKKDYFRAVNPEVLLERAEAAAASVSSVLPELKALQSEIKGAPSVRVLTGKAGMRSVYNEIAQASSIRFWTNLSTFEKVFSDTFDELSTTIVTNQVRTKEIIADTSEARRSSKRYAAVAGKYYSSRLATIEGIGDDSAVFGDMVALFRLEQYNFYVIRIQDAAIARSTKALFDMAWNSAKPFIN